MGSERTATIMLLPGDGIGPEIVAEARAVLALAGARHGVEFAFDEALVGGVSIDALGAPITDDVLARAQAADAVLLGAVGGPKWDNVDPAIRPEKALFALRKGLGLFANLRPVAPRPSLLSASTLRPEVLTGVDLLVVRELTGGLYFGEPRLRKPVAGGEMAIDTLTYTTEEIHRIAVKAFEAARGRRLRVTSVDKANVLESSRLWRETVTAVAASYPDVALDHMLVDNCAMQLVRNPRQFDVIVTENLFGDILSDEAAMLTGSIGMLPSASIGASPTQGMFEPIHGSAPDIAGQGKANPIATILSAAMLLRHSLGMEEAAAEVEAAVDAALDQGLRTADLAQPGCAAATTTEMGAAIRQALSR